MAQKADDIFKEFKEHSIAEFFGKNRQMLGYSSMARSLVTIVHEYVTNGLDACEEAGILPAIFVRLEKIEDNRYRVRVSDNGPGIPKGFVGKALATVLAGTKFHRNMQQRGQQGIGASGCTLFAQTTTGKAIHVVSSTGGRAFECDVSLDTLHNKPIISNLKETGAAPTGLAVEGEFGNVKYYSGEHSAFEYLKRTALSNPHAEITFTDPDGKEHTFLRSIEAVPERPRIAKLHPLGLSVSDLFEQAHASQGGRISAFLVESFARLSQDKANELRDALPGIDFSKAPKELTWEECDTIIKAFRGMKWISPDAAHIIPIGERQITAALKNILNPEFLHVIERKPKVFSGGFPFIVEAAIAYGGNSGRKVETGYAGNVMRFANRVPLLFDTGSCAISSAVNDVDWKRYGIDMETQPVSILVNVSSVHIPYSGVGKESIAQEDDIIEEIKLAVMDAARGVQHFIRGKEQTKAYESKYRTVMRYTGQLSQDLGELTGRSRESIEEALERLVSKHYRKDEKPEEGRK
jgi:DNA topoisomerase-6 subunit B